MEPSAEGTPAVLTFGEALVGYGTVEDNLRVGTRFTRFPGGAELNVAVGLTRLGTRATWASVLGDDPHGDYLVDAVADLGVGLAVRRAAGPTALMFKAGGRDSDPEVLQVRAATAFAEHAGSVLTDGLMSFVGVSHLHLTGIVLGISPESRSAALALLDAARSHGATVSFDPNLRLNLWPDHDEMRAIVNAVAGQATVVFPALGEGSLLTGRGGTSGDRGFYLEAGAERVVVKLGADGAQAWGGGQTVRSRPYRVNPVDTVGAGDGFAAGYLDAFVADRDPQDCIDQAAAVGALATTRRGDLTAMPTRAELDLFSRRLVHLVVAGVTAGGCSSTVRNSGDLRMPTSMPRSVRRSRLAVRWHADVVVAERDLESPVGSGERRFGIRRHGHRRLARVAVEETAVAGAGAQAAQRERAVGQTGPEPAGATEGGVGVRREMDRGIGGAAVQESRPVDVPEAFEDHDVVRLFDDLPPRATEGRIVGEGHRTVAGTTVE